MPPALTRRAAVAAGVKSSPWIHLAVLPPAVTAVLSWAASATPAEQAAAWSLVTVAGTVAAGFLRRPVHAAVSSAAVTAIAGDLAVLAAHLPASLAPAALAAVSLLSPAASRISSPAKQAGQPKVIEFPEPAVPWKGPSPFLVPPAVPEEPPAGPQFPAGR